MAVKPGLSQRVIIGVYIRNLARSNLLFLSCLPFSFNNMAATVFLGHFSLDIFHQCR